MEIWKDIPGYNGVYQVSNYGSIKSLGNNRKRKEKFLKLQDNKGYKRVQLFTYGGKEKLLVHRLVMKTFIGDSNLQVNHINHNPSDNRLENLEYVTPRQNCNMKKIHLLQCPNCNHNFYDKKDRN